MRNWDKFGTLIEVMFFVGTIAAIKFGWQDIKAFIKETKIDRQR